MATIGLDGPAELFPIRNGLYLGNYAVALAKAQQINVSSPDLKVQRDALMHRANIGLGELDTVISQAVRLLAVYLYALKSKNESSRKRSTQQILQILEDPVQAQEPIIVAIAATMFLHENNDSQVLKLVNNPSTLELVSIQVKTLIRMNRVDLAEQALKHMVDMNDDATITQLTSALVALAKGGHERVEEAEIIFQQLQKKFGNSLTVLNGLALCMIQSGAFENAERTLLNALGLSPNDPDTLINMIVCAQHLKKPEEVISKYLTQLQSIAPNHAWVKAYNQLDAEFDELVHTYQQ